MWGYIVIQGGIIMGIKNKIIGILALAIIVPLIITGASSYVKASHLLTENFIESNISLTGEIAETLNREFEGYLFGVKTVADNFNARDIVNDPTHAPYLLDSFEAYVKHYPDAFQMYIGTLDGTIRIHPDYDFDDDYDPRKRFWYELAETTGEAGWTSMYQDAVTGNWSISGTAPVYNMNDKFIGAVATSLDLSEVSEMIGEIKVGEEGYVFILDDQGRVVGHPDPNQVGKVMPIDEVLQVINDKKLSGVVDYQYTNKEGKSSDKYAVYSYVDSLGWYIMTSMYYDEITNSTRSMLNNALIIGLITLLVAGVLGVFFANSLTKPIAQIVDDMDKVEQGDMTVISKIKTKDEIGLLSKKFNNMIGNVRQLLENASDVTRNVSDASQTLAASAEEASASSEEVNRTIGEIAQGATDQAHDTETAAKLVGNLDEKFENLHTNSQEISTNAENVKEVNYAGAKVLSELKEKSEENNQSTIRISEAIRNLEEKSRDIGGILVTISSIAEQTNLLALNASIEAARAGEAGRGFAVVADEIRKLAEESSTSAEEIGKIVAVIQEQTNDTVSIMDEFKENSDQQYKAVEEMDKSFEAISSSIESVSQQIEGIDDYITEMLNDKNDITNSITNISSVSEETAAASEEVSATMDQQNAAVDAVAKSADELSALSRQLSEQINKFKI